MSNDNLKILKTMIGKGCYLLKYEYKPQQRTINLTRFQKIVELVLLKPY